MKFHVMANKTYRVELTVEREYEVDVTKKAVVDAGLCTNVVDGDPTAWYDYVEDYLREKGLEEFMDNRKVWSYENNTLCHEEIERLEVTEILKQHIDKAIDEEEPPCSDEDGIGLDVQEVDCSIESVESQ